MEQLKKNHRQNKLFIIGAVVGPSEVTLLALRRMHQWHLPHYIIAIHEYRLGVQ